MARLLAAAFLALYAATAYGQSWGITELMKSLAAVKHYEAHFVELRYSRFLEEPIRISGSLSFIAPHRLLKHSRTPVDEVFVIDGHELTVERDVEGQRKQYKASVFSFPALLPLVQGVRSTLAGDLQGLREYYSVALSGSPDDWRLRLTPYTDLYSDGADASFGDRVKHIEILGRDARITSIEIVENSGDRSVTTVTPKPLQQ